MIDISFLKPPGNVLQKYSGLEYMDWQIKSSFFNELKDKLASIYDHELQSYDLTKDNREELNSIIAKHTNLKIDIVVSNTLAAINTGYIIPGHVMNPSEYERWLDKKYSNFAAAFKTLKTDVIKGWADPKTGKVEGDFKKIEFTLQLSPTPFSFLNKDKVDKTDYTVSEMMAAFILHECGHAFGSLLYLSSKIIDTAIVTQALNQYIDATDSVRKATIIKEANSSLECLPTTPIDNMTEEQVVIYFSKNIINRDYRRSLSIGTVEITSEVLADAYASRFGAGKQLIAGLASFGFTTQKSLLVSSLVISIILSFFLGTGIIGGFVLVLLALNIAFQQILLVQHNYDTPYRRLKTILRDHISTLNSSVYPKSEKIKMIKSLRDIDDLVEENKTYFESTALQRFFGWMVNGADFRKSDFENYTADLVSTRLDLYSKNFLS